MKETTPYWKSKIEQLYKKIEYKISFIKELWREMKRLGPPNPHDSAADIAEENEIFEKCLYRLKTLFPEIENKAERYINLKKKRDELAAELPDIPVGPDEEIYNQISAEIDVVEAEIEKIFDDDVWFFINIKQGLQEARKKREIIRKILLDLGEIEPLSYKNLVKKYKLPKEFINHVVAIVPENFSITFIVERENFEKKFGTTLLGIHFGNTIWNFVKYITEPSPEEQLAIAIYKPQKLTKVYPPLQKTINHENFHSFLECFPVKEKYRLRERIKLMHLIRSRIKEAKKFERMGMKSSAVRARQLLARRLRLFMDYLHEELMAIIVTYGGHELLLMGGLPRLTFSREVLNFCNFLKDLREKEKLEKYPEIDAIIQNALSYFNPEEVIKRILELYKEVEESVPERIDDLDIALILFPPSKFHHVESLVKRWTLSD